jgi:hypothetical protein
MKYLVLLLAVISLNGCSTYAVQRYSISTDNVMALREIKDKKINVGSFTSQQPGLSSITCRGVGPIKTPDGEAYSEYVRKALIDELKIADVYSSEAPITLTGQLNSIDFSSNSGEWNFSLTINSSNGRSMTASESYSYTTSFYGETACNQTAQAVMPAVQDLIGKVVRNPEFKALLK